MQKPLDIKFERLFRALGFLPRPVPDSTFYRRPHAPGAQQAMVLDPFHKNWYMRTAINDLGEDFPVVIEFNVRLTKGGDPTKLDISISPKTVANRHCWDNIIGRNKIALYLGLTRDKLLNNQLVYRKIGGRERVFKEAANRMLAPYANI